MENTTRPTLTLCAVQDEDAEFLYRVYASTRQEELALFGWNSMQQEAFLRMQFAAQTQHYHARYAGADFLLIRHGQRPVGRLTIHRSDSDIHLVDLALLPEARGQGLGSALLRALLAEADQTGRPVSLHVERSNRALRIYERLGFQRVADDGVYCHMQRLPLPSIAK